MAEIRPFRALRYAPGLDLGALICPPFDVIKDEHRVALQSLSPYNAVHLELPGEGEDRYQRAAQLLRRWRQEGILVPDMSPAFYLLEQQFWHHGSIRRRRALMCRVRLEPWEAGTVRPHEHILRGPKEDRLHLLRALRTQVSPVFGLLPDPLGKVRSLLEDDAWQEVSTFQGFDGQSYALRRLPDHQRAGEIREALAPLTIYIADGHHRYETALAYREERRANSPTWTGEEPENFVLMGLVAAEDPGIVLLPIHRLVARGAPLELALHRLGGMFELQTVPSLPALLDLMARHGRAVTTLGLASAQSPDLYLLSLLDPEAVSQVLPKDAPRIWRHLDSAVAHYVVILHALGLRPEEVEQEGMIGYVSDPQEALERVRAGQYQYALFLNPPRVTQVMKVADAGYRMPPKSTYFHPKLPAGVLFYALDLEG